MITDTLNKHFVNIIKKLKLKVTESETNELALSKILVSNERRKEFMQRINFTAEIS